ncbi:MAG: transporter substrate-binding domain-containing protein [Desulfamplus sp.]
MFTHEKMPKIEQSVKKQLNITLFVIIAALSLLMPYNHSFAADSLNIKKLLTTEEKSWIEANPTLKAAGPKSFPPFSFFDDNDAATGIAYDYLTLIMGQLGIRLEIEKALPWKDVLSKAKADELDIISCVAKAPDREEYLLFSKPYLSFPLVIISRKESQFIGGLEDLTGLKVAMVKQNVVYEWLNRDKIDVVYYFQESALECLKAVSSGRADAYIDNLASATYMIEEYGLTNLKVAAPTAYENYQLHFGVRKEFPELASIINKSLDLFTKEQHMQIRNKWLSVRYEYGISPDDLKRWGFFIGIPLFLIIAVILFWNRRLKHEIDVRKRFELALQESERRYREIFESSRDGFVFVDINGGFIDANQAYCDMLGYTLDELKAKESFYDITPEKWKELELKNIWEAKLLVDGYSGIYQKEYIRKDGTIFPVELQAYAFFDKSSTATLEPTQSNGHGSKPNDCKTDNSKPDQQNQSNRRAAPSYLWAVTRDITAVKRAQEERERLQEQLSQAHKMESIGRLAGGIAHDFNNMLSVIIGHSELAIIELDDNKPIKNKIIHIRNAAERSANLIQQLLAYARKQRITPKVVNLNDTLNNILKMLQNLTGESIDIEYLPEENLWNVKVDPTQVDQLLTNLCVNARDAILSSGKNSGTIAIKTENITFKDIPFEPDSGISAGEYVQLEVSDNGCGMAKETVDKIFEPFFTTKELGKGTGLGLATVYGIIKQNNGFINVYSEPNVGTSFKIYLPKYETYEI